MSVRLGAVAFRRLMFAPAMPVTSATALLLTLLLAPPSPAQQGSPQAVPGLASRALLDAGPLRLPVFAGDEARAPVGGYRLVIKLVDDVRGRALDAGLVSLRGADLSPLTDLASTESLSFRPLIDIAPARVEALVQRASLNSGRAQPDLMAMLVVGVPSDDASELLRLGESLRALPQVEYAHVQLLGCPPPGDISPTTPDLSGNQGYLGTDPGVNAEAAWIQAVFGAGVRVSDCEYGWDYLHEEYNAVDLNPEPGQTIVSDVYGYEWDDHGTAVLGEMVAPHNGYGVRGICPEVELATYPEWTNEGGFRRVASIASAIADSDAGDVVLLEMQTVNFGDDYGPAELDPSVFTLVKAGVDAGVAVVGAAGNGGQYLDGATYASYQGWGDSGAILVGAGSSNTSHVQLGFSTYGSRINLQGWGVGVFSAGYGSFAQYGGDEHQSYISYFSGTSSASPMVVGAVALVQARSIVLNGVGLPPLQVRQILMDTGTPQGGGGHIGPLPHVALALATMGAGFDPDPWVDLGLGLAGVNGVPQQDIVAVLVAGTSFSLTVTSAKPAVAAWWVLGLSNLSAPFKGGTLVPSPDLLGLSFTGFGGSFGVTGDYPNGIPVGTRFFSQFWMPDPQALQGYSASNALQGTAQ